MSDVAYDPNGNRQAGADWIKGLYSSYGNARAGRQLATGNVRGAASALARTGDLRGSLALTEQADQSEAAKKEQEVRVTLQVARALRQERDAGRDPLAALDAYRPTLMQIGVDEPTFGSIRTLIASNPQALEQIESLAGEQARQLEIQNLGNGYAVAIDKGTGAVVNEYRAPQGVKAVGDVLFDADAGQVILDAREPKYQTIQNTDGSTSLVAIDQPAPIRGGGSGTTDPNAILDRILEREGGFVASDGRSGAPANFGINQRANPDIDVRNLTEERARQIYQERYINPIVQAGVSGPALEAVIDFGVNAGVGRSLDFWRRSGGDIDEFNRLRLQHYRSLPDYDRNGRSWERRVAETTPGQRGSEVPVQGGVRTIATGANNGPSPAQARAEQREERADLQAQSALRREFNNRQEVKDFRTVEAAYDSVRAAGANPSAAGDLSLIFAYMKILDPTSVVREQEFANAQNAAGVPDQIRNQYNRILNGQRLNPNQRRDFLGQAENLYRTRRDTFERVSSEYRTEAELSGFSADRIVPQRPSARRSGPPFEITPAQREAAARVAAQREPGRRYRVGDRLNPVDINPASRETQLQSLRNIRPGQWFIPHTGGEPIQMPNPNPYIAQRRRR